MSAKADLDVFRTEYFKNAAPGAMPLKAELEAFRANFVARTPPAIQEAIARTNIELAASGILERAKTVGDRAPDFTLPDARGGTVSLADQLAKGPVVLSFYRGAWCPYCNLELRALQNTLPDFTRLGASLVAISPQTPDRSMSTAEKNALTFPVLSDANSSIAKAYGIAFDLAEVLRPIYAGAGHVLPEVNGADSWTLPLPATYLIGRDGRIATAYFDADYRNRLDPRDLLATLEKM